MTALHGALSPNGGVKLAHVATVLNGGTPRADDVNWNGDLPFVTPPDLRGLDGDSIVETSRSLTELGASSGSTVAVSGLAVSCRAPIGYVGRLSRRSAFNQGCKAVVPSPAVDEKYLAYVLVAARPVLEALGRGTTFMEISASDLGSLLVPATGREEQRRIADYLDRETATIGALIEKQVELMNRLRERRQAVIDRAFVSTSEIVILRRHLVLNDSGAWGEDPTGADDVAVLRSTEQTVDGYWAIGDPALRKLSQTERQNTRLREGDLLVTKTSGSFKHVGKTTLVDNEVAEGGYGFGNFMQRLRLRPTMIPKFLWWFMRADQARSWINLVATTSTGLMNLNGSTLGRMEVPLPSLVEQREIADHLDRETAKIDALIAKAERFIELAQERRAALITAAVTGQIEIPHTTPRETH